MGMSAKNFTGHVGCEEAGVVGRTLGMACPRVLRDLLRTIDA